MVKTQFAPWETCFGRSR